MLNYSRELIPVGKVKGYAYSDKYFYQEKLPKFLPIRTDLNFFQISEIQQVLYKVTCSF